MKFALVAVIVPEEHEDLAVDKVKEAGAAGVTVLKASGLGLKEKKTFFGLSYERNESVLLCIVEKSVGVNILKFVRDALNLDKHGNGLAFSIPMDHLVGMDIASIEKFQTEREEI